MRPDRPMGSGSPPVQRIRRCKSGMPAMGATSSPIVGIKTKCWMWRGRLMASISHQRVLIRRCRCGMPEMAQKGVAGTAPVPNGGDVCLFGFFYLRCLSSFWRSGRFWCQLVQLTQWSGCDAFLFADELGVDFFSTLKERQYTAEQTSAYNGRRRSMDHTYERDTSIRRTPMGLPSASTVTGAN